MITYETARNIALCYQDIKSGNNLLEECNKKITETGSLSYSESGSDKVSHLQLGMPTSFSSRKIIEVDDNLAIKMIIKHIEDKEQELKVLNILAKREMNE